MLQFRYSSRTFFWRSGPVGVPHFAAALRALYTVYRQMDWCPDTPTYMYTRENTEIGRAAKSVRRGRRVAAVVCSSREPSAAREPRHAPSRKVGISPRVFGFIGHPGSDVATAGAGAGYFGRPVAQTAVRARRKRLSSRPAAALAPEANRGRFNRYQRESCVGNCGYSVLTTQNARTAPFGRPAPRRFTGAHTAPGKGAQALQSDPQRNGSSRPPQRPW